MLTLMKDYLGAPIERQVAWQLFDRWKNLEQEIGVIFWSRCASLYTLAVVESARNGSVQLKGEVARASFNLAEATFTYGPMQTWPRWPLPPIVEVTALRAKFANGEYLILAEGLTPQSVSSPLLAE